MAVGPRLISVQPNDGDILTNNEIRDIAPRDLVFQFQEGQTINSATLAQGVRLTRSGFDGVFDNGNDVIVTPGFVGIGDAPNEVVMRFRETLPDDKYRLELFAVDNTNVTPQIRAIRNTDTSDDPLGERLVPQVPGTDRDTVLFELDLGAQITAVVPQPLTRNPATNKLVQAENQIVVYFNNDDLDESSAENPEFYQLIHTRDTTSNNDDLIFNPTLVVYDKDADTATLTFAAPLQNLAATVEPSLAGKASTFRLRIGTDEVAPAAPTTIDVAGAATAKDRFNIELIFPDTSIAPEFQQAMRAAADRWEEIIVGDLPDVGVIDDIAITVLGLNEAAVGPESDGPGGFFGESIPTALRPDSRLPWRALMRFDVADLRALTDPRNSGTGNHLVDEMTHQIAHALGFGELWQLFGFVQGSGSTDPRYTGQSALAKYNAVFGVSELSVPIEFADASTFNIFSVPIPSNEFGEKTISEIQELHWRESIFRNELGSSRLIDQVVLNDPPAFPATPGLTDEDYNGIQNDNPLSVITIAAMEDLGYTVDFSKADPYQPVGNVTPPVFAGPIPPGNTPAGADVTINVEPGSRFETAVGLETNFNTGLGLTSSVLLSSSIDPQFFPLDLPGAENEPGHRHVEYEEHIRGEEKDRDNVIPTYKYNFDKINPIGYDLQGSPLPNVITAAQMQRAREIFEIFSNLYGIEFVETATEGFTIATGDPRAVDPFFPTGAGGLLAVSHVIPDAQGFLQPNDPQPEPLGGGIVIMDNAEAWNDTFGGNWFQTAMNEIGQLLGLGFSTELPGLTLQTSHLEGPLNPAATDVGDIGPVLPAEPVFPGDHDIVHGQHLFRPQQKDIDLYRFSIEAAGLFTAETFSERLPDSSSLDTYMVLYRQTDAVASVTSSLNTNGAVAINFSARTAGPSGDEIQIIVTKSDRGAITRAPGISVAGSIITVDLNSNPAAGTQADDLVGVLNAHPMAGALVQAAVVSGVASTNLSTAPINYSPLRLSGGAVRELIARNDDYFSEDSYIELELEPGVYYLGVTASGNDQYDPTINDTGFGGTSEGDYQLRLNFRPEVNSALLDDTGTKFDGDANGTPGGVYDFWFRTAPALNRSTMTVRDPAVIFVDKANQPPVGQPQPTGERDNPFNSIQAAFSFIAAQRAARPALEPITPYLVRVVGNGGADRNLGTVADNLPYVLGFAPGTGTPLADGGLLDIPQDVTMMVDEGAIFKTRLSSINVGSESPSVDRSGGALQVLGTPTNSVIFTSYNDETTGVDTNPNVPQTPQAGDWGGLLFRRDQDLRESRFDWERRGIFLNYVNHANIRYGGGRVNIGSVDQKISPVEMIESRPTVTFNTITLSADAAISADPNSFEETNFHAPQAQFPDVFTSDFQRVGPDVHGNRISNNSKNGLFIRISTVPGAALREQTVSGRWDDIDIPHLLSEHLVLAGTPGGAFLERVAPPTNLVTFPPSVTPGDLNEGERYLYRFTFVDRNGFESPPSAIVPSPTDNPPVATVNEASPPDADTKGSIQINGIPQVPANSEFVGRRVYRLSRPLLPGEGSANDVPANVPYILVAEMDRTDTVFVDTGSELGFRAVLGDRTSAPVGGILDTNINTLEGIHRPRFDARLAIDPGAVVKLEGARIQANMGTQFIAEGTDDLNIVFTSQRDDRFGGSGTFDSNNDDALGAAESTPAAGNWGGLVFNHSSIASIDHALLTYGGGVTTLGQSFSGFNVIEIHQAEARITNSVIENNANGKGGQLGNTNRAGIGANVPAAIFVRGAQPIIVSNIIRNNGQTTGAAAISINANALNHELKLDYGRSRGLAERFTEFQRNAGPLVQENRMIINGLNALDVRGGILTTQSVWDDTDIVHVVRDRIYVPDFHTYGGLRLKNNANESLVVKLFGAQAGFTATGNALDIDDRIGGMLHVSGQPGFPVIFTSLRDDSVGAGFTPQGTPQNDTNGDLGTTQAAPGDWRSIELSRYAHDRNVEIVFELETEDAAAPGTNSTPSAAETLGSLAPHEKGGDDNLRLGFEVHGALNAPSDVDVYSFKAKPGTEVWIDVDRTTHSLDTVIELIDSTGRIIAQSDNSYYEGIGAETLFENNPATSDNIDANVLQKSLFLPKDHWTSNPRDAGFRIVLPGPPNPAQLPTYHVRIRSSNIDRAAGGNPADLRDPTKLLDGLTSGQYQFQVRLREVDEFPGSTVRFSDIRYATNGVEVNGQVIHSPLLGEAVEIVDTSQPHDDNNDTLGAAQPVGNLAETDRAAIAIAGTLVLPFAPNQTNPDVDFYRFEIRYENLQNIPDYTNPTRHMPVVFDLDYADGIARANTTVSIFDAQGRLILTGRDSNIAEDQPEPLNGADVDNLDRGSVGSLDPYIGPVELPEGTYYLAVSTSIELPTVLDQLQRRTATDVLTRIEPISSTKRIIEDRLDDTFNGVLNVDPINSTVRDNNDVNTQRYPNHPAEHTAILNDGNLGFTRFDAQGRPITFDSRVGFNLGDVSLFVSQDVGTDTSRMWMVDPFTGTTETRVGNTYPLDVGDIVVHPHDSKIYAFFTDLEAGDPTDADAGRYFRIDPGTAATQLIGDDGIETFQDTGAGGTERSRPGDPDGDGYHFEAMTYSAEGNALRLFAVGSRNFFPGDDISPFNTRVRHDKNILYMFNPDNGAAISAGGTRPASPDLRALGAGTQIVERGRLRTATTIRIGNGANTPAVPGLYSINILTQDTPPVVLDTVSYTATALDTTATVAQGLRNAWIARQAATMGAGADSFDPPVLVQEIDTFFAGGVGPVDALEVRFRDRGQLQLTVSGPGAGAIVNDGGFGPGGEVTGMAFIQGTRQHYAVSDEGGLYRVNNVFSSAGVQGTSPGQASLTFIANLFDHNDTATPIDDTPLPFEGLTAGPVNAEGGRYANLVFAMDINGNMIAIDPENPVPGTLEKVFNDNQTILRTGLSNVQGLDFSNLDFNLWHQTVFATDDPFRYFDEGHGVPITFDMATGSYDDNNPDADNNRTAPVNDEREGETSFYFGYAGETRAAFVYGLNNIDPFRPRWGTNSNGGLNVGQTYDFAGGAYGSLESATFSLEGYTAADKPALYFNYLMNAENVTSPSEPMRDSFRVFATDDSGDWILLTTSNSITYPGLPRFDELPEENQDFVPIGPVRVQEIFEDPTPPTDPNYAPDWRQARVDVSPLAGKSNVRLRFDFSTAGSMDVGNPLTQGDEIRAIDGAKLRDQMYMVIEDYNFETGFPGARTAFEVDTGYTLVAPSGAKILDGDFFTIDGVRYEFDNETSGAGNGVTGGSIEIPYSIFDTPEQVAYNIQVAVEVNYVPGMYTADPTTESVPGAPTNDTRDTAIRTGLIMGGDTFTATGAIGDNEELILDPVTEQPLFPNVTASQDVDVYRIRIPEGASITITTDTDAYGNALDTFIELYEATSKTRVASNNNAFGLGTDSRIVYQPGTALADPNVPPEQLPNEPGFITEPGYYYIVVHGNGNQFGFDPDFQGSGNGSFTTGQYDLTIDVRNPDEPVLPGGALDFYESFRNDIEVPYTFVNTHLVDNRVNIPGARIIPGPGSGMISTNLVPDPRGYPFNRFIEGSAGVTNPANVRIPLYAGMTDVQVADSLAQVFADVYQGGDRRLVKQFEEIVRLIEHRVVDRLGAPPGVTIIQPQAQFGLAGGQDLFFDQNFDPQFVLPGDEFGEFTHPLRSWRGQNNHFEGLYIDDIILGFTERGEMVFDSTNTAATFSNDRDRRFEQVAEGAYQVEIRRATDYATSLSHPLIREPLVEGLLDIERQFDTNDRLEHSVSLTVPAGWKIKEGRTFTLSDGVKTLTFEFDDTELTNQVPVPNANFVVGPGVKAGNVRIAYRNFEPADVIAERVRDAINSPQVQDAFDITATLSDGTVTGLSSTSATVNLHGNVIGNIPDNRNAVGYDPFNFGDIHATFFGVNQTPQTVRTSEGLVVTNNVIEHDYSSDNNRFRDQGQIIIHSNQISFSEEFGINFDAGNRGSEAGENNPHPGPVRNLRELNDERLVPSAVIENNIVFRNNGGGIRFAGDATQGSQEASVPFGRIVNNTVFGGSISTGPQGLVRIGPNSFTPAATTVVFSEAGHPIGETNPVYNFTNVPTFGTMDVSFGGHFVGQSATNGNPNTLLDNTPTGPLQLDPAAPNVSIVTDASNATSPVLSGTPTFNGPISVLFSTPVAAVALDGGFFNAVGGVSIEAYAADGTVLGRVTNTATGIETFGLADASGANVIAGISFFVTGNEPFGFGIDNLRFGSSNEVLLPGGGAGILVENFASPTVLNNIVAGLDTGIIVRNGSNTTVVGGTLYQDNVVNATGIPTPGNPLGDSPIVLQSGDPLFVDAQNDNYYLALGSQAIDSGINSLGDRDEMLRVRTPLGIDPSPIISPEFDAFGQLRVDDPVVNPPAGGTGETPFIDRGALDRADLLGVNAFLLNPRDNDAEGRDRDPTVSVVQRQDGVFTEFLVQLNDGPSAVDPQDGVGVDDNSVTPEAVTITENGRRMVQGVDYTFAYDRTNNVIRLTPVAGIFLPGGVYVITLNNTDKFFIDAPNGAEVLDGEDFYMTDAAGNRVEFEYESGYSLFVQQSLEIQVPVQGGGTGGILDRDRFTVSVGAQTVTFEFDLNSGGLSNPNNRAIPFTPNDSAAIIAQKIVDALNAANLGLAPKVLPGGKVHVGATSTTTLNTSQSRLTQRGVARPVMDGDNFTIDYALPNQPAQVITFEFDADGSLNNMANIAIPFTIADATDDLALRIIEYIENNGPVSFGNYDLDLSPVYLGDGHIHVGGTVNHLVDTAQADPGVTQFGAPGGRRAFGIQVPFGGAGVGGITDGQTFTISNGLNTVTFEFDNNGVITGLNNDVIPFQTGDSADVIADLLVTAISNANLNLQPTRVPRSAVNLGGANSAFSLNVQNTTLRQIGTPGVPAAVPVVFTPDDSFTDSDMAIAILNAVNSARAQGLLTNVTVVARGPEVTLEGVQAVNPGTSGTAAQFVNAIQDIAGNDLQPNQPAGETRFTILLGGANLDFGDAPDGSIDPMGQFRYPTRFVDAGARHVITGTNPLFLGSGVDADANGQPSASALGDDTDHRIDLGTSPLTLQTRVPFSLTVPPGSAFGDGETFTLTNGANTVTFEFDTSGAPDLNDPTNTRVAITGADTAADVANKVVAAIRSRFSLLNLSPIVFDGASINLGGTNQHTLTNNSAMSPALVAPASLTTPGAAAAAQLPQVLTLIVPVQGGKTGGIDDGERFVLTDSVGSVVFEFESNGSVGAGVRAVEFTAASTPEQIAEAIVQAIEDFQADPAGRDLGLTPVHLGAGQVHLGGPAGLTVNTTSTKVTQIGSASPINNGETFTLSDGVQNFTFEFTNDGMFAANFGIDFDESTTLDQYANAIVAAVQLSGLNLAARNLGNGVVEFDIADPTGDVNLAGATSLSRTGVVGGVADGDTFTINNGISVFTFEFDRNGATTSGNLAVPFTANSTPDSIASALATAIGGAISGLAPTVSGATVNLGGDDEDGVVFRGAINPFIDTPITVTASRAGVLDAWVDFNRDGDWSDPGEKIFDRVPLLLGQNDLAFRATSAAIVTTASPTYARFRVSSLGGLEPFGLASDGEVEDYRVDIIPGAPAMAVNDPDANAQVHDPAQFRTSEDAILNSTESVLENDFDTDNDPISIVLTPGQMVYQTTSANGAQVTVNADGTFTYNPLGAAAVQALDVNETLVDTFTYTITDGTNLAGSPLSVGTVSITVTGANDAPTPGNDPDPVLHTASNFATTEDAAIATNNQVRLFINDRDPENHPLTFVSFTPTSAMGAVVVVNADGTFSYNPTQATAIQALEAGEIVVDTFTYTVTDGSLQGTATVSITLTGVNDAPIGVNDPTTPGDPNYTVSEDGILGPDPALRNLLANDRDAEGNLALIANTINSNRGARVMLNADGTFTYDPSTSTALQAMRSGQTLTDTFVYTATDGVATYNGTVTITVTGANDGPRAVNDPSTPNNPAYTTTEDTVISPNMSVRLTANDSDPEGDTFTLSTFQAVSNKGAIVQVFANGTFSYDPRQAPALQALGPGQSTTDTFTYTLIDSNNATGTGTVTITVTGTDDDPQANPDPGVDPPPAAFRTTEDNVLTLNGGLLLANDGDPEGGGGTLTIVAAGFPQTSANGATVTYDPQTGVFTYDPRTAAMLQALGAGDELDDTFTYRVTDGARTSAPGTVTIRVSGVNDAPIAQNDVRTTETAISTRIPVLTNDTDADSPLNLTSVQVVDAPNDGFVTINGDGTISYQSDTTFTGVDTFTYRVADDTGAFSNVATVTITVNARLHPWQNPSNNLDVNDDGLVTLLDALLVVNTLRDFGNPTDLENTPNGPAPNRTPFVDPTGDEIVSVADLLPIVTFLRNQIQNGGGEANGEGEAIDGAAIVAAGVSVIDAGADAAFPGYHVLTNITSESYFRRLQEQEYDSAVSAFAEDELLTEDEENAVLVYADTNDNDNTVDLLDGEDDTTNLAALDALFSEGFDV